MAVIFYYLYSIQSHPIQRLEPRTFRNGIVDIDHSNTSSIVENPMGRRGPGAEHDSTFRSRSFRCRSNRRKGNCKDYSQKKYHVGKQVDMDADEAYEQYSDETLRANDMAFFMKIQDIVRCAVDESRFLMTVDKMKEAMHIPLTHDPVQEVELLADTYQLNQSERGNVLRSLFMGRDLSRYGMMNAIPDASKLAASYEIYYYEQLQK